MGKPDIGVDVSFFGVLIHEKIYSQKSLHLYILTWASQMLVKGRRFPYLLTLEGTNHAKCVGVVGRLCVMRRIVLTWGHHPSLTLNFQSHNSHNITKIIIKTELG